MATHNTKKKLDQKPFYYYIGVMVTCLIVDFFISTNGQFTYYYSGKDVTAYPLEVLPRIIFYTFFFLAIIKLKPFNSSKIGLYLAVSYYIICLIIWNYFSVGIDGTKLSLDQALIPYLVLNPLFACIILPLLLLLIYIVRKI